MSGAAWLQLAVLIALVLVGTRLLGAYLARVFGGGRAPGDRCLPARRAAALPARRDRSEARAAVARLRAVAARVQRSSRCSASTCSSGSRACCRSIRPTCDGGPAGARVQHRGQLRHEHELAELRRRVDDEPPDADGRADRAELRLGRGRDRGRDRARPRPRAPPVGRRSATSGSTSSAATTACPAAARVRGRAGAREPGRRADPARVQRRRTTLEGASQPISGRPIASQEAIKELGTNGGGIVERELGAPVREPDRLHEPRRDLRAAADPVRAHLRLRAAGRAISGRAGRSSRRCSRSGSARPRLATHFEVDGNPRIEALRAAAGTWRARRCASAPPPRRSSPRRRPAPRPARSTRRTTASRRSAAPCRS